MRTTKRFDPSVLDRFKRQGRGQGTHQAYQPWHQVTRGDPASCGRSHLMHWRGRLHHLLSDLEWDAQLFGLMPAELEDSIGIHSIQRPSLKAFARDSGLRRFWIQIQKSALYVLIEREWLGRCADPTRHRLTIQRIRRSVLHAEHAHDAWLYLEDDREAIESLLMHVMRRFSGVSEIALCEHAVWSGHRQSTIGPEKPHPRQCEWLVELGFVLERTEPRAGGHYVKRLG